jgi:hypothetical protein
MLQIFNRVVHRRLRQEDPVNKKLTLAVAATAVAGLLALVGAPLLHQSGAASQPTFAMAPGAFNTASYKLRFELKFSLN